MRIQSGSLPVAKTVKPALIRRLNTLDTTKMFWRKNPHVPPALPTVGGKGADAIPMTDRHQPGSVALLLTVMNAIVGTVGGVEPAAAVSSQGYRLARSLSGPDQPPPDPFVLLITSTTFKLIFATCWFLLALALYRRARSRNFKPVAWLVLALLFGPFAWIVFALCCRNRGNIEQETDKLD